MDTPHNSRAAFFLFNMCIHVCSASAHMYVFPTLIIVRVCVAKHAITIQILFFIC